MGISNINVACIVDEMRNPLQRGDKLRRCDSRGTYGVKYKFLRCIAEDGGYTILLQTPCGAVIETDGDPIGVFVYLPGLVKV